MFLRAVLILILATSIFLPSRLFAGGCVLFKEGDFLTVKGKVLKTLMEVEDRENAPRKEVFMLIPDKPLCYGATSVPLFPSALAAKFLGKHVAVSGRPEGDFAGWHINVSNVKSID